MLFIFYLSTWRLSLWLHEMLKTGVVLSHYIRIITLIHNLNTALHKKYFVYNLHLFKFSLFLQLNY